jgi:hypothetical protein
MYLSSGSASYHPSCEAIAITFFAHEMVYEALISCRVISPQVKRQRDSFDVKERTAAKCARSYDEGIA